MKRQPFAVGLLTGAMLFSQLGWVGVAEAERHRQPASSPAPSVEASASPSPSLSPSPSPSPLASPSASPSAGPSSSPVPEKKPQSSSTAQASPDDCTNVVPDWVFDTTTQEWVAANKGSFSCDKTSGYFLSPLYFYDKQSGWYQIMPAETAATMPDVVTAPNVVHTVLGDLTVGSKDYEVAKSLGLLNSTDGITVSGTGAGSSDQASATGNDQSWMDLTNLVKVVNTLQSTATSGDVQAGSNTQVGDLSTGTASVVANVINLLASAWSWSHGDLNFFMRNYGDHLGDLTVSPNQAATADGGGVGNKTTLDVNAKDSGSITNNIDLNAKSGDALAVKNTAAGDVATGDATAQVNIVNLINSFINSGSSFFGILNLFGTFDGDILFPDGFLNGLVASGSGSASAGVAGTINSTSSQNVNNNIQTTANSGAATATANTGVGNVMTGSATTQQGLFNLANSSIFGDNAVLVIVNVLGHWVGKIMSLPGSNTTSSALLTGNAQVAVNGTGADSANINQQSVGSITNNVNVNAQSGKADATKNTQVGNVSTGDAKATSSVANIFNTIMNVKNWFGVLVINVFGDWTGDVNNNTSAGGSQPPSPAATGGSVDVPLTKIPRFGVAAIFDSSSSSLHTGSVAGAATSGGTGNGSASIASTASVQGGAASGSSAAAPATQVASAASKDMSGLFMISAVIMLLAGALASIDRRLKLRRK